MQDLFWHPKIAFLNLLSIRRKDGLGYGKMQNYHAYNNHTFTMGEDIEIKFTCNFHFPKFPFDKNECDLIYYVQLLSSATIILSPTSWVDYWGNHITPEKNETLMLTNTTSSEFKIWVEITPNFTVWGDFESATGIKVHFQRDSIALLLGSFYVPTGLIAILSMTSYVINPEIVSFDLNSFFGLS